MGLRKGNIFNSSIKGKFDNLIRKNEGYYLLYSFLSNVEYEILYMLGGLWFDYLKEWWYKGFRNLVMMVKVFIIYIYRNKGVGRFY